MKRFLLIFLICLICGCSKKIHIITEYDGDRVIHWYTKDKQE